MAFIRSSKNHIFNLKRKFENLKRSKKSYKKRIWTFKRINEKINIKQTNKQETIETYSKNFYVQ